MADKRIRDLVAGDQIQIASPPGRARVLAVGQTVQTKVKRFGAAPGEPDAFAVVVDFQMREGPHEGRRDYVFAHPDDRVRLA